MDRAQLADFLRRRRERMTPAEVGLSPGLRRRTPGLRREEVAQLAGMSTDYLARLEQSRGPQPSTQVLAALARALRLTDDERDHLFYLAGRTPPASHGRRAHVSPGLLHMLDHGDQFLVVLFARPGTDAREKLDLLRVIGTQDLTTASAARIFG